MQGLVKATRQLEIFFPRKDVLPDAFGFTLSNEAIHEFDKAHPAPGREPAPAPIRWMYSLLLYFVDEVFKEPIGRFWFLETVRLSLNVCVLHCSVSPPCHSACMCVLQ